ncbi:MAG: metallophosphoesterase, partial [Propionibacteriaceae bacterium]|nr:metallophosphoesterase [Propionibacteriaceae bacterium]
MIVVASIVGSLLLIGVWWAFDHALTRWTRLPKPWGWIVHALLGVLIVGAGLSMSVARSLPDIQRWRPVTSGFLVGAAWLFYTGLGVAVIAVVNAVWHLIEWSRARRRTAESDEVAESGEVVESVEPVEDDQPTDVPARPRRALAGEPSRPAKAVTTRRVFLRWAVCGVVVLAAATTALGFVRARTPQVTQVTVASDDLPASFQGFRIALVADIHVGPSVSGEFVKDLVTRVNAQEPDLIVIAGDLVDGSVAQLGPELEALADLEAPYGTVLTTGNHEFFTDGVDDWLDYWRAQGITVLDNSGVQLARGGSTIDVLGINDATGSGPHQPDLVAAATTLLDSFGTPLAGDDRFRLLVAHQPLQAEEMLGPPFDSSLPRHLGIDVQLSGHTHGGQLWPFRYAVYLQQPVVDGVHEVEGIQVVTTRGAGSWGPPVRVLADPEIVMVT